MLQQAMEFLAQYDPELGTSIQEEFARECRHIELIASENIVSEAVMLAQGSCLTNKYAEGYPGKRYYGGCYAVDVTEELARQRALLICGEKDRAGSCIRYNKAWHQRTGIPIHWLKNAGHNSNTDEPQLVNQILDAFLQEIKEQDH